MEEAEALCGRIGIMVHGRLMALGGPQHLKTAFGKGFCLTVQSAPSQREQLVQWVQVALPSAQLEEGSSHGGEVKFDVPIGTASWRHGPDSQELYGLVALYTMCENAPEEAGLESYAVSQTSLEEVFISLAGHNQYVKDRCVGFDDAWVDFVQARYVGFDDTWEQFAG